MIAWLKIKLLEYQQAAAFGMMRRTGGDFSPWADDYREATDKLNAERAKQWEASIRRTE